MSNIGLLHEQSYLEEVALGNVPNRKSVNKFGHSTNVDASVVTDIWDRANGVNDQKIWVPPNGARIHTIVSSVNNDSGLGGVNPLGDGGHSVRVYGLTDWNTLESSEDIVLDGTTGVNTVNSYVIIHRIKFLEWGGNANGPNVGRITATAAVDATVTAQIEPAEGQTQMAIYGVPSVQNVLVHGYYISELFIGGAAEILANLKVNPIPQIERRNYLVKSHIGLRGGGVSTFYHHYPVPPNFSGPCIIKVQVFSDTDDMEVSAGFDLVLANKNS